MKLSTASQALVVAVLSIGLLACVDPAGQFEAFDKRVPDAAPPPPVPDAEILVTLPDITGRHLLAMAATIAPTTPFQFIADVVLDGTTVDITLTPLHATDRTAVGGTPLMVSDVPVNDTGKFAANFTGMVLGTANPVTGSDITLDLTLNGSILDEDSFCGDVSGGITAPIALDITGSTVGAIRVADGIFGDDLPEPVVACPE